MFFLSFTTHADRQGGGQANKKRWRLERVVTGGLLLAWVGLMMFGVVCLVNPGWLQELARPGIDVEVRDFKNFGDAQLRQGNYRAAIAHYRKALAIKADQLSVRVNLAIAYSQVGQGGEGVRILEEALGHQDEGRGKGVICYNLARLYAKQGSRDQAIRHYRQAVGFDVQQELVYRELAMVYLSAERYEEARLAFEQTVATQVDQTLPYQYMLHRSVEQYQKDATSCAVIEEQIVRGVSPADLERYDMEVVRETHARDPEIAKTHNHLAYVYARLGNSAKAIEHFEESLRIWPGNVDAKRNLERLRR